MMKAEWVELKIYGLNLLLLLLLLLIISLIIHLNPELVGG
jgi:hypothetical protein